MSDNEARLRIVLDAINNAGDELKRLQDDLKKTGDESKKTKGGFGELAGKFEDLTGVSIPTAVTLGGVGAAVGAVYEVVSSSVGRFGEYAEQVRDLSYAYNLNAEQASTLVQVLDDARVAPASLETAFRTMADKGIQPTIENLADLADKFVSIQDPVEKSAFLAETFGSRAGPEMAKALGLGGYALRQYAQDARDAGLLLSDADLAAAERLKQAQDRLADAQTQFDKTVGLTGTQVYTELLDVAGDAWSQLGQWWQELIPHQQTQYEWVQETGRAYAEMADEADRETRRFTGNFNTGLEEVAASEKDVEANAKSMLAVLNAGMSGSLTKENEKFGKTQEELAKKAAELKTELDKLNASNGQYYQYTTNSEISANELALAQLQLSKAQTELAETTDPEKQLQLQIRMEGLQEKIAGASTTVEGYIDNSKKIGELSSEYDEVNAAIEENKKAHDEATKRIIWNMIQQQYAVDGLSTDEIAALTDIGESMGIYDTETARIMRSVQESIRAHGTDAIAVLHDVDAAYENLRNKPDITKTITTRYTQIGSEPGGSSPVVVTPDTQVVTPVDGAYATGGSFIVPGTGSGDRPYMVNLTPGELVTVSPTGNGSAARTDVARQASISINIYQQPGESGTALAQRVAIEVGTVARMQNLALG